MAKHLQEVWVSQSTYLQYTPDFLRQLQQINIQGRLPENAMLVVADAIGFYTNISKMNVYNVSGKL